MSTNQLTWILRTATGKMKGPYPTAQILTMIAEGQLTGQELISKYPDGKWTLVSKEPEFYDRLLASLEQADKVDSAKNAVIIGEDTIFMPPPPVNSSAKTSPKGEAKPVPKSDPDAGIGPQNFQRPKELSTPTETLPASQVIPSISSSGKVIDLSQSSSGGNANLEKIKTRIMPLALIGISLVLVWFYVSGDSGAADSEKIHLIGPGKMTSEMPQKETKEKLAQAINLIEADSVEGLVTAEKLLVKISEGNPSNLEVRGMLCLVYKQLWPFSYQDSADQKVIASVSQSTRSLNLTSQFGSLCESVKLITLGRYREARSVVDATLDSGEQFSLLPALYFIKGELLDGDRDYVNALPYLEKATQLWDRWLAPLMAAATVQSKTKDNSAAAKNLKLLLEKNPKHKSAKLLLGIIEYKAFKQVENALTELLSASALKARSPRLLESEGLEVLASILIEKDEKSKALKYAERAYQLNPSNTIAKQLVLRLGGSEKVKDQAGQNNELIFAGDQFNRQGDYLSAQAEYKAAFEANPKNGTAAMKAAKCLWQLNQSYEAIEWLGKAIKADPKLVTAYVLQADYMSQRYDFMGAAIALQNATRIAANSYEVLRGQASLELRKGNLQAALTYASRALKAYDGDIETYVVLSKASSGLANLMVAATKKEVEKKDELAKDAIRFATKAVEIDATSQEAQVNYAKMLALTNGVDSGISYMNEMIRKFSYNLDYRIALAEIYKSEDRFTQAKTIYEQVTEADPRNKKAFIGLADSYKALGLVDKALRAYLSAAVIDPTDAEALSLAAKVYLESGRYDEAIENYGRVQKVNPNQPKTFYGIAKAQFAKGNFAAATEAVNAEKRQNPNLADSYFLAAEIFSAKRQFTDCAKEYSLALKLRPQGAENYVKAATCYRQSGNLDIAENMLELAAGRESGYAEIYREQGAIFEQKGDSRSAVTSYNKYLGLSPNASDRKEIELRLMKLGN